MVRCAGLGCMLGLIFAVAGQAQTSASGASAAAPPSKPADSPQKPVPTIRTNAQLVVVDVVVKDGYHRAVHGLKASDFVVTENNIPQTISHFEEHVATSAADATKFAEMPKFPPGIFTNYTPAPENGSLNVLLLDELNTPMRDQSFVRDQLLAFLKTAAPGTRIAIFGLKTRLLLLQGFTSDPEALKNVLLKKRSNGSPLLDDVVGGGGIKSSQADVMEDLDADPEMVANLRQFEAQQQSFQLQLRAKYTLDAMSALARYLANIPGRKNLIWFSGSFPLEVLPDASGTLPNPFAIMGDAGDEFRDTVNLLARSRVSVYPIDARGLMTSPIFDASTSRNYGGPRGASRIMEDEASFFRNTASEQSTMRAMASATGGRAFVNTNGLAEAVATAIDDGSNFYTLTYTPTNSQPDGKLRKIKVQPTRPGVTAVYRQGYYAATPQEGKVASAVRPASASDSVGKPTPAIAAHAAMMRGAPVPSEILIKVGVVPMSRTETEEKVAADNIPTERAKGPYRRYSVNYAIDPSGITFVRDADGKVHSDFDLIIFVFDADGALINSGSHTVHMAGTLEQMKKRILQGIYEHEEISAPAKGEYFLRIAVHDEKRDLYGAVEVPTSVVRNVVPIAPAPPPKTPGSK